MIRVRLALLPCRCQIDQSLYWKRDVVIVQLPYGAVKLRCADWR